MYAAIQLGLVQSCHDLSEGGLAIAAAEMMMGSPLGAVLDASQVPSQVELSPSAAWFSETPTRFLVEVAEADLSAFLGQFRGQAVHSVGMVTDIPKLELKVADETLATFSTPDLLKANQVS